MFDKNKQKRYLKKRWKKITDQLASYAQTRDPEALHQLRVNVKKLRAMLYLSEGTFYQDNLPRSYREIRKLFKHTGLIRCAQINLVLLDKFGINEDKLHKKLERIIVKESQKLVANQKKYEEKLEVSANYFLKHFMDLDNRYVLRLCEKQLQLVASLITEAPDPTHLHNCRKRIKSLIYIKNALHPYLAQGLHLNTTYLKKVEDAIGDLHDVALLQKLLRMNDFKDQKMLDELDKKRVALQQAVHKQTKNFREKATG